MSHQLKAPEGFPERILAELDRRKEARQERADNLFFGPPGIEERIAQIEIDIGFLMAALRLVAGHTVESNTNPEKK